MDEADLAQVSIDFHAALALKSVQRSAFSVQGCGSLYCVDCGVEIPEPRRVALPGCDRCVKCQAAAEEGTE